MAVPNPEDELQRLGKLLQKGLPPVVLITGGNDPFRAEAVDRALAAVPKDVDLRVLDAWEERASGGGGAEEGGGDDDGDDDGAGADAAAGRACAELQDLRGGGLFARASCLVVRRGSGWWQRHAESAAALLPRFGKGCSLLVEAPKLDKRKKAAQQLVKQVAEAGGFFEFRELYDLPFDRARGPLEGELCKWLVARALKLGVPLTPEAAWLVVMQVGKATPELLAELQRLRDRVGADPKRKPLAPADLRGQLTCSFGSTPFELAEAVLADDRRAAWRSARAMFDRGVRAKDGKQMDAAGVLPFATSWLHGQFAAALEGRQLLDAGVSERDVAQKCGVFQFVDRFVATIRRHPAARLRRGLLAVHACQRLARLTGEEPDALLERFLAQWFDGAPIPAAEDLEL
ncbi:MAG: DNA polymerase III subunit delta [Planctomycetota bacterium]|jgi:DNA polymerase III delta subunit